MNFFDRTKTFSFLILTISICYALFGTLPSNYGDPFVYLLLAKDIFSGISQFEVLRSPGYPLFLKIFSINLKFVYLITIFQIIIFVFCAVLLEREVNKHHKKSYIIYLLLAFPDITYMQTLMFPDGLIFSMICLYIYSLLIKNFKIIFFTSLILFSLKSYLLFIPIFSLIILFENYFLLISKLKIKYFFTLIFPIFFYIFTPTHLVQPFFTKINAENLSIDFTKNCNTERVTINREDVNDAFLNKINVYTFRNGPIIVKDINTDCIKSFNNYLSRSIINDIILNQPIEVSSNIVINFASSLSGIGTSDHITSMISEQFWIRHESIINNEIKPLQYGNQITILDQHTHPLLVNLNILIDKFNLFHIVIMNKIQLIISMILIFIALFFVLKKRYTVECKNIFALNLNFAIMHGIFAMVIVDRYIFFVLLFNIVIILFSLKNDPK